MKTCSICKQHLPLSSFGKDKYKRDLLTVSCKSCTKLVRNGYRQPPRPIVTEKFCKVCNTIKPIDEFYKHSGTCKPCVSIVNRSKRELVSKPPRIYSSNPKSVYKRKKRQTDPLFKLRCNIGSLIANRLRSHGYSKTSKTATILGCTFEEFFEHIESQFIEGMSWDNRNCWHIDHIVPLQVATTEQELLLLNHYTNLRPMWKKDNQQKAATLTEESLVHPLYAIVKNNQVSL